MSVKKDFSLAQAFTPAGGRTANDDFSLAQTFTSGDRKTIMG
jgi:hypothetical protein